MGNIDSAATFTTADVLELNAIVDAIIADWYPHRRPGDPVPAMPPARIMDEARDLALRHRLVAARQRGQLAA